MKLDQTSLNYISAVIRTAELVKIGNIIIEPGRVRAIDDDRTIVIFHEQDVPDMPFGAIGINRINVFNDRLELAKSQDNFSVEVEVRDAESDAPWAKALTFKGKGIKVEYRCANPKTIQAPKTLSDGEKYAIRMTADALALMNKGVSAMKADSVTIFGTNEGVFFEMADINGDALTYRFGDVAEDLVDGEDVEFSNKYPVKTLIPVLKLLPNAEVIITNRGLIKLKANGLTIYAIPSV